MLGAGWPTTCAQPFGFGWTRERGSALSPDAVVVNGCPRATVPLHANAGPPRLGPVSLSWFSFRSLFAIRSFVSFNYVFSAPDLCTFDACVSLLHALKIMHGRLHSSCIDIRPLPLIGELSCLVAYVLCVRSSPRYQGSALPSFTSFWPGHFTAEITAIELK